MKKILSMFLALCMVVTLLPVTAMAEEIHTSIGTSGEIISFAPLAETEKTVSPGKSSEDLELPETLSATVRTAVPADENPVQDSGSPETATLTTATEPEWEETTADVPVRWVSPDYDMNAEGVYVFTPVVEGYTVRAPLPEITVTVGEMLPIAAARRLVTPMSTTTDYNVWVGGVQVTSENKEDVLGTDDVGATVTYDPDTSTLTLRGATIIYSGGNTIYTVQQDLTVVLIGVNTVTSTSTTDVTAFNTISGGSLTFRGDGRLTASGKYGGIYAYDDITIESGTISSTGQKAGICSNNGAIIISGGDVTSTATTSVGYGVKRDWWSALSLTVSGSATLTAIGTGGAKAIGSVNLNITHAVMAGNDASSAVPVPSPDADTWESAYVKLTPFAAVVLDSGGAAKDYYQTFAEALQNAVNGDIVRLLKEITLAVPATITNKSITLDLNGKKLTSAQVQTLAYISSPGDTLTITDSAGGGVVENTYASTQGKALVNSSTGTVEVISGTIRSTGVYGYGIHNASIGTITVSGGSVEATGDQYVSGLYYSARAIDNNGGGVVNISGTAQVTGVTGNGYAITSNKASGVVNISGGVVSSEKNFALGGSESGRIKGRVNITGGEIRSGIDLANGTTVNISGGTLAPGKISVPVDSTLVITGGNMGFNLYGGVAVNGQVPPVAVVPYVLTIPGEGNKAVTELTVTPELDYTYGMNDVKTDDSGNLTVCLPLGKTGVSVTIDGTTYSGETVRVSEEYSNWGYTATLTPPAPSYTITANPTTKDFGPLTIGYTAPAAQTVIITNTGNSSVTLTQPTSTSYTIGALSTTTLAAGGTATFTVAPKVGLAVGNYNETLTVSTNHSTNATVNLSFSVTAVPTYTITANPTSKNFGSLAVGYSAPTAQTMTITNTGNTSVTLTQPTSTNYTIGALSTTTLAANGTATFTVAPKAGLAVGNYNETLTVSTNHSTNATVELSFSVTAVPDYTVTFNPNGGTVSETSRSVASGTAVGTLPTPTRSGSYSFDGWYTSASGGTQISASTTVSANVTYYAHWTYTGGNSGPGTPTPPDPGIPVVIDGKTVNIGTEKKTGDTTTVTVDQSKLAEYISGAASGSSVIVQVSETGSATASLMVQNIADMATNGMTLTVQTGSVSYNLSTSAIDTSALETAFPGADMSKVPFDVTITNSSVSVAGETLVLSPVSFTVTATYNGQTVSVDTFSAYIDRVIEVTKEQAAKITTAVVVNADGSVRHVPTNVIEKDGKYYAVVSSRTNSTYALIQNEVTFSDAEGKWYEAAVNEMGSRKIIGGRSAAVFDGGASITRAEFSAILVRALGLPADGASTFADVPTNAWYAGAVATAVQYGITDGRGNNRFDPSAAITRQEAMLMLQRAAALTEFTGAAGNLDRFADADGVDAWARDAAMWSVGSGLIQGADGKLNPTADITRAESATIILRLLQKVGLVDVRSEA